MPLIRKLIYAMIYGDLMMNVANQVRPYELNERRHRRHGGDLDQTG